MRTLYEPDLFQSGSVNKTVISKRVSTCDYERGLRQAAQHLIISQGRVKQGITDILCFEKAGDPFDPVGRKGNGVRTLDQRSLLYVSEQKVGEHVGLDQPWDYEDLALESDGFTASARCAELLRHRGS